MALIYATGNRPGEMLAVRWMELDLTPHQSFVDITGTIIETRRLGAWRLDIPNTESSVRYLAVPE